MDHVQENVVLLHGRFPERINGMLIADVPLCDPNNEGNWMGWTKRELIKRGYEADCPVIKDVWKSSWPEWKHALDAVRVDKNTTLVGWSAGGYAILRYLGETGKTVKRVILVAPGAPEMDRDDGERLPNEDASYSFPITKSLKRQITDRVIILVSNDEDFILRAVDMYEKVLDATVVRLEGRGHFSFLIKELPELLQVIVQD